MFKELSEGVLNGDLNALSVYIDLKRFEKDLAEAIKEVQGFAIQEAEKYPEKSFEAFGASVEKKNGTSRWDYSNIREWNLAKERLKQIEVIAQVGGMDESGNEIPKAFKIEGKPTISISFKK